MRLRVRFLGLLSLAAYLCGMALFVTPMRNAIALPIAVRSSLGLTAVLDTDLTYPDLADSLILNQAGSYYPNPLSATVVVDAPSSTGGDSHADAFGDAQWVDSSQGSVRLDVAVWQHNSNGFVVSGGPGASPGWEYTFVADKTGTFRLDFDIQGNAMGDFGALGFAQVGAYDFKWTDGFGNDLGSTLWRFPNLPTPLPPAFNFGAIGQETRQVVAGNTYSIRLNPQALFQHPFSSVSGDIFIVGMFDWSVDTASAAPPARTVFLDFGNGSWQPGSGSTPGWGSLIAKLTGDVQIPVFSTAEMQEIETGIAAELFNIFQGFDIGFVLAQPTSGTYDSIDFKQDQASSNLGAPPNQFGWARFDWLNANGSETGEVFPDEFDSILDEYSGGADYGTPEREAAIQEITRSLANVAAHELGHTYGLAHLDAYGNPTIDPAATGGKQNRHVMGTGGSNGTGMLEAEHETRRTFSRYSIAKLEATSSASAEPISSTSFASTTETSSQHADRISAQNIDAEFQFLPISVTEAVNIRGGAIDVTDGINADGNRADWYEFTLSKPALLTAQVLSQEGPYFNSAVAAELHLHDATTVLEEAHELHYERDFMNFNPSMAGLTSQWEDPLLMDILLQAGTYYLEVESFLSSTGDYDLFVNLTFPGDIDGDGDVDGDDFLVWQANFGKKGGALPQDGDLDGDGDVDGDDFLIWQVEFGSGAGQSSAVPEPSAIGIVFLGLAGLLLRAKPSRSGLPSRT